MKVAEDEKKVIPSIRKNTTWAWTSVEGEEMKKNDISIRCLKCVQNLIYVILLFILTLILLVQIYYCMAHYANRPTYIETKFAPQHKALFPAMTICPQNGGYNEDVLKVLLMLFYMFKLLFIFNVAACLNC